MGREKSICDAMPHICRALDQEYDRYQENYSGSDFLDQQLLGRIDKGVDAALASKSRQRLPKLPEGYAWVEYEAPDENGMPVALRVRTPKGEVIDFQEVSTHRFVTDRSIAGRAVRTWERTLEGLRDSIFRREWDINRYIMPQMTTPLGLPLHLQVNASNIANIPFQAAVASGSQAAAEMQDWLGLESWKYGPNRPDDLWEAGTDAYKEWMKKAHVVGLLLGGAIGKTSPKSFLTKYDQDYIEALVATGSVEAAKVMAGPYGGRSHHSLIRWPAVRKAKQAGRQWLVDFAESDWNKPNTTGWSRLDFGKYHDRVHKNTITSRMPNGMPSLNPRDFGVKKYGPFGRFWYGMPLKTRAVMASPFAIGGGTILWDEVRDEPKIPDRN